MPKPSSQEAAIAGLFGRIPQEDDIERPTPMDEIAPLLGYDSFHNPEFGPDDLERLLFGGLHSGNVDAGMWRMPQYLPGAPGGGPMVPREGNVSMMLRVLKGQ